jgi:anti-repressor protein
VSSSDIALFEFQGQQIRTVVRDGEPYWVAKDVCDLLGYTNAGQVTRWLDSSDFTTVKYDEVFPGQAANALDASRRIALVTESGLYELIFRSARPEARAFKHWVTSVVLPTIRKTGAYVDPSSKLAQAVATDPAAALEMVADVLGIARQLQEKNQELTARNTELVAEHVVIAPKAAAYDAWFDSNDTCSVRDAARMLRNLFVIGEYELREKMRRRWRWVEVHSTAATAYAVGRDYMVNHIHTNEFGPCPASGRLTPKGFQRLKQKLAKELPPERHLIPAPPGI